jgi:polyvinyl alcohol dehydrogenase (cytochrome)
MRLNGLSPNNANELAPKNTGRVWMPCIAVLLATVAAGLLMSTPARAQDWAAHGFDSSNSAFSPFEWAISPWSVGQLKPKWTFTTGGDVSARAAVVNGVVYFPDWGGNLWALDARTGKEIWGNQLSTYVTGLGPVVARATPTIDHGVLYIGTQQNGWFLAINAANGKLIWKTRLDTTAYAIVTTSAVVVNGVVYTGVANTQESNIAGAPGTAKGSVVALDARTGNILWQTFTTVSGYSGVGVWGSSPVVDLQRGTLYIGTGDNYTSPTDPNYLSCISGGGTAATCQSPNNQVDSILALDIRNGKIKWSYKAVNWDQPGVTNGSDFFNLSCLYDLYPPYDTPGCPKPQGPDYDFGQGPSEITYWGPWGPRQIIGAGQKSGIYYAFDPDSGALLWQTQVGPGSSLGGMEWGSATDGQRIYVAITNYYGIPWAAGPAGGWAALDPATGKILWTAGDPNGSNALGPVTVANGVVFVPSMGGTKTNPNMLALDAATGKTLWSYPAGSSVIAGATVVNGVVYWGSGYSHLGALLPQFTGGNTFYAFSINGN